MAARRWLAAALLAVVSAASPAAAQETTFKAGVAFSSLTGDGAGYWDERVVAQTFGAAVRFRFGPVAIQPELMATTRGAGASAAPELEQMRFEHFELPVLLVVPVRVGALEPYAFAGPSIILEARCRYVERVGGLRTTTDCDPPGGAVFSRTALDWALVGGAGASYPIGGGRLLLEGRHLRGLRNIRDEDGGEVFNRSWAIVLGYSMGL